MSISPPLPNPLPYDYRMTRRLYKSPQTRWEVCIHIFYILIMYLQDVIYALVFFCWGDFCLKAFFHNHTFRFSLFFLLILKCWCTKIFRNLDSSSFFFLQILVQIDQFMSQKRNSLHKSSFYKSNWELHYT